MLLLSYWSILVFIFPCFTSTQDTTWTLDVCFKYTKNSIYIYVNNKVSINVKNPNWEYCLYTEYILNSLEKPMDIQIKIKYDNSYHSVNYYQAVTQNHELQEVYVFDNMGTNKKSNYKFEKWVYWQLTVIHNEINCNSYYSLTIDPYGEKIIEFRRDSRISNASFFLPLRMNNRSKIDLLTNGKFWLDKIIKLKNLETSKIYSCIYVLKQSAHTPYHNCSLTSDNHWKIELTSHLNTSTNTQRTEILGGVTLSGTKYSEQVTFKKLAYLPTLWAYINIGNKAIDEVEIYFTDNNKYVDILKIVITKTLSGEEYGCVNIQHTYQQNYSCKLLKSKSWLLKVISPEEHERDFLAEILQDTLSSFSRILTWKHFSMYGDNYIKYFNLKTFEDGEITGITLHFFNKSLRVNEISMIKNHLEYEFKTTEASNNHESLEIEFLKKTKEEICSNDVTFKTEEICSNDVTFKTVIGILAAISFFLAIVCIILLVRNNMSRNNNKNQGNVSKGEATSTYTSTQQVIELDNPYSSIGHTNTIVISEPRSLSEQASQDVYENIDKEPTLTSSGFSDIDLLYAQPHKNPAPQPSDNLDIEQLYTQPIKYICR